MDINVSWYLHGRIIYAPGGNHPMLDALCNAQLLEMINAEGTAPMVHILIDHTNPYCIEDFDHLPIHMNAYIEQADEAIRWKLDNHHFRGWVVEIMGREIRLPKICEYQQRHAVVTLNDALHFLYRQDASLPAFKVV